MTSLDVVDRRRGRTTLAVNRELSSASLSVCRGVAILNAALSYLCDAALSRVCDTAFDHNLLALLGLQRSQVYNSK